MSRGPRAYYLPTAIEGGESRPPPRCRDGALGVAGQSLASAHRTAFPLPYPAPALSTAGAGQGRGPWRM